MISRPSHSLALALALALGSWTTTARAQDDGGGQDAREDMQGGGMTEERELNDQAARQHFRVATRYYEEGRFRDAAQQFAEAYQLSHRPELLYNAYIAFREANELREAANMLESYLEQREDAPDRQNLEARLTELRRAVEEQEAQQERLVEAERRAQEEAARAAEEARARRQAESAPEAWPWVVLGVGAAAVVAGAVTGGVALSESAALVDDCNEDGLCPESANHEERRDTATTLALATDVLLFGGAAVAVAGLVLGLVFGLPQGGDDEEAPEEGVTGVSLGCTAAACGGALSGRF